MVIDFVNIDRVIEDRRLDPYYYSPLFVNFYKRIVKFESVNLGSLLKTITNGLDFREYSKTGTPYIKVANVKQGEFDFSKVQYVTFDSFDITKQIQLKKGNILLTRKGTFGNALYLNDNYNYVISSEVFNLDIKQEKINSKYLEIVLNSQIGQIQFDRNKIGAIMGSLSQEAVKQIKVPLPPKGIQQQIVDLYQHAVEEKQTKEQEAEGLLAGIDDYLLKELGIVLSVKVEKERYFEVNIFDLIGERLDVDFNSSTKYGDLFKSISSAKYPMRKISEICDNIFQGVGKNETQDNSYTLLKVKNILPNNEIDYEDIEFIQSVPKSKLLKKYDILSPFIGEAIRQIKFSVFDKKGNFTVDNNTGVIRVMNNVNAIYVCEYLCSTLGRIQINRLIGGGGVPFIGSYGAKKLQINVPPIEKQNEIAEHIQSIRVKAKRLQEEAKNVLEKAKIEIEKMIIEG